MTTLLKYISIFATPVRRTYDGASTGYKGCEEAVMAIFFFIKFNVEMIYRNGECRAIYPRLSRGHDFAGLFSTLGIKEVFKKALERPENFIPKFVLSYIEMVFNSKQENPSWNCFWIYGWVLLTFFKYHQQGCFNDPIFSNLGLHAACWALVMCHHELCPTLVSDTVLLSYTEAALWLYKEWFMVTQRGRLLLELLHWYPVI